MISKWFIFGRGGYNALKKPPLSTNEGCVLVFSLQCLIPSYPHEPPIKNHCLNVLKEFFSLIVTHMYIGNKTTKVITFFSFYFIFTLFFFNFLFNSVSYVSILSDVHSILHSANLWLRMRWVHFCIHSYQMRRTWK